MWSPSTVGDSWKAEFMMLPIVEHMRVSSSQRLELEKLAERMAAQLLEEHPEFAIPAEFQNLRPNCLGEGADVAPG